MSVVNNSIFDQTIFFFYCATWSACSDIFLSQPLSFYFGFFFSPSDCQIFWVLSSHPWCAQINCLVSILVLVSFKCSSVFLSESHGPLLHYVRVALKHRISINGDWLDASNSSPLKYLKTWKKTAKFVARNIV